MSVVTNFLDTNKRFANYTGTSQDDKPPSGRGLIDGSFFDESDTGDRYVRKARAWVLLEPQGVIAMRVRLGVLEAQNAVSTVKLEALTARLDILAPPVVPGPPS